MGITCLHVESFAGHGHDGALPMLLVDLEQRLLKCFGLGLPHTQQDAAPGTEAVWTLDHTTVVVLSPGRQQQLLLRWKTISAGTTPC